MMVGMMMVVVMVMHSGNLRARQGRPRDLP
jgi:hypothetical protein